MEAWVVGAGGFLGGALVRHLRHRGHEVRGFTRADPPDLAAIAADGPATVFWLASTINPSVAEAAPEHAEADIAAVRSAVDAVAAGTSRIVIAGSGGTVYDPSNVPPYDESMPTAGSGRYAAAKLAMERVVLERSEITGRRVVLRVSNAYGPGQRPISGQGVVAYWLEAARAHGRLTMIGDPETSRDFVYVDDVAAAFTAVHEASGTLPDVINIGSGVPTSLAAVLGVVRDVVGADLDVDTRPARGFDLPRTYLDIALAARVLGWKPEMSLHGGVAAAWRALGEGS